MGIQRGLKNVRSFAVFNYYLACPRLYEGGYWGLVSDKLTSNVNFSIQCIYLIFQSIFSSSILLSIVSRRNWKRVFHADFDVELKKCGVLPPPRQPFAPPPPDLVQYPSRKWDKKCNMPGNVSEIWVKCDIERVMHRFPPGAPVSSYIHYKSNNIVNGSNNVLVDAQLSIQYCFTVRYVTFSMLYFLSHFGDEYWTRLWPNVYISQAASKYYLELWSDCLLGVYCITASKIVDPHLSAYASGESLSVILTYVARYFTSSHRHIP
jgi:hypothetical protein